MDMDCSHRCRSKQHAHQLLTAITKGNLRQIQLLLSKCHNTGSASDRFGRTCLHLAASKGKWEVVEWLMEHKHADLTVRDLESGWTALHRALFYGQLHVTTLLTANGGSLTVRDKEGLTPLDLAMKDRLPHVDFSAGGVNEVYSWGDNTNFTLGHDNEQRRRQPEPIEFFRKQTIRITQVYMSKYHTVFRDWTGKVYTCGHGRGGRLGHGNEQTCLSPKLVSSLKSEVCIQVSAARDHTVFLMENGTVFSCGLNDNHQLGLFSPPKFVLTPKQMNGKQLKGRVIKGVCAQRFHTILYTDNTVFTFGLNAGQLGHMKVAGETHVSQPRQVTAINNKHVQIKLVSASDAATVVATTSGEVYVLHEYQTRKLAIKAEKWMELSQVCVSGGHLDHSTDHDILHEKGGTQLIIMLLMASGKVYIWRGSDQTMRRCAWSLKRPLSIQKVALSVNKIAFITRDGEGFIAPVPKARLREAQESTSQKEPYSPTIKEDHSDEWSKIDFSSKGGSGEWIRQSLGGDVGEREQLEETKVERLPNIHRAVNITMDRKGTNFTVLQSRPNSCLTEIPCMQRSETVVQFDTLLQEADEFDLIHDAIIEIGTSRIAVHKFILSSRSEYFRKIFTTKCEDIMTAEKPTISIDDVNLELFNQMLKFIYTDTCDLLSIGKAFKFKATSSDRPDAPENKEESDMVEVDDGKRISAFEVYEKKRKKKGQDKEKENEKYKEQKSQNPVKIMKDMAKKFGVKYLLKRLDAVRYLDGKIHPVYGKHLPPPNLRLDRKKYGMMQDVGIEAEDGVTIRCHKCVLVARLEYFHSMLSSGWIETSHHQALTLPVPGDILEVLLDFIYTDDADTINSCEDPEFLCNVLVVADQLLIGRLKDMCEVAITQLLTLKNCCEILEFASVYNASQLKATCQQFICLNLAALVETRALEVCSSDTLNHLTDYYRNMVPGMSRRLITPYDDWPSHEYLEDLEAAYQNMDLPNPQTAHKEEPLSAKKTKHKRRRTRTKSSGEDGNVSDGGQPRRMSERQISVSSETDVTMEMDDVIEENNESPWQQQQQQPLKPEKNTWRKVRLTSQPVTIPVKREKSNPWSMTSPSMTSPSMTGACSPVEGQGEAASPPLITPPMASSPPDYGDSLPSPTQATPLLGLRDIMEHEEKMYRATKKISAPIVVKKTKVSNKEKRRQLLASQQKEQAESPLVGEGAKQKAWGPPPPPAWGSVNKVVKSFKDLMLDEEKCKKSEMEISPKVVGKSHFQAGPGGDTAISWGLPMSGSVKHQSRSAQVPVSPTSPGDNPWQQARERGSGKVNFSQIVKDEIHQTETLQRMTSKPLALIQIEEQAIQELMLQYGAEHNLDEYITVERVPRQLAKPTWAAKTERR